MTSTHDLPLLVKPGTGRHPTHYDTLPHGNCSDPLRCDCECPACLRAYARIRSTREQLRVKRILWLLAHPKAYQRFPAPDVFERLVAVCRTRDLYSAQTEDAILRMSLRQTIPIVRGLRARLGAGEPT